MATTVPDPPNAADDRPSTRAINPNRKKKYRREFYEDWPWFGFPQAERIPWSFWAWVAMLTLLAILIIVCFATLHPVLGIIMVFVTAAVAAFPFSMLKMDRI